MVMRLIERSILFVLAAAMLAPAHAQQAADNSVDTSVQNPMFPAGAGPVVAIDSGHHNFHTAQGRYAPFASLLKSDGLKVVDLAGGFSAPALGETRLLVIANALSEASSKDWTAVRESAFSPAEIEAVTQWVRAGGSLLLIADHRPFAGNAKALAAALGFSFADGVARRPPPSQAPDIFTVADGTLKDEEILSGRNESEKVTSVETFTGSAFQAPASAQPVIVLPDRYRIYACGLPCPAQAPSIAADGFYQGAVLRLGRGKVAVFGEAAMFSAQTMMTPDRRPFRFGFNGPSAKQNKQFVLNLVRWLVSPGS
jgi:hypothetical protein